MEYLQTIYLMYTVPIAIVIVGIITVYAVGFRTPVAPPSFDGFEDEKKRDKKRKTKENPKQGKVAQNNKLNGNPVKSAAPLLTKKKEIVVKPSTEERPKELKSTAADKKITKTKQGDKVGSPEDLPVDDWFIQGKKGKKYTMSEFKQAKKDITTAIKKEFPEIVGKITDQSVLYSMSLEKKSSGNDSRRSSSVEEKPKANISLSQDASLSNVDKSAKELIDSTNTNEIIKEDDMSKVNVSEGSKDLKKKKKKIVTAVVSENTVPESVIHVPDDITVEPVVVKTKKRKKKNAEKVAPEEESGVDLNVVSNLQPLPDLINVTFINEEGKSKKKNTSETILSDIADTSSVPTKTSVEHSVSESDIQSVADKSREPELDVSKSQKPSNIAFDELAGLYPEPKEQKKKKKVRRDH